MAIDPTSAQSIGKTIECPWMWYAINYLGVPEFQGNVLAASYFVEKYLRAIGAPVITPGHSEDGHVGWAGHVQRSHVTYWCSAFANYCMSQAGIEGTGSAAAISWAHWGQRLPAPRFGCVTVLKRKGGNHVGFFSSRTNHGTLCLLGGNQSNHVCYSDKFLDENVLAYRWPSDE